MKNRLIACQGGCSRLKVAVLTEFSRSYVIIPPYNMVDGQRNFTPAEAHKGGGEKEFTLRTPNEEEVAKVDRSTRIFAAYTIQQQYGNKVTAEGYVLSAKLALHDLETGIDTKTGKPIEGLFAELTHQPPVVYHLLDRAIPRIGDLIFQPEFATEVRRHWNEVEKKKREAHQNPDSLQPLQLVCQ
jgi:hypothetical protein